MSLPFLFCGETRIYRVIGIQGDTIMGFNFSTRFDTDGNNRITLAFACLGSPPEGSPFIKRSSASFLCFSSSDMSQQHEQALGCRLQKIDFIIGENLPVPEMMAHLQDNLPKLHMWLDTTLENAGILPSYNKVEEVFDFFLNNTGLEQKKFEFDLKPLGKYNLDHDFDYSKYI